MTQVIPFGNFGGLDLVTVDDEASPLRCRSGRNIQKRRSNAIARRPGNKIVSDNTGNNGGLGTFIYKRRDPSTGAVTTEKLIVGSKLYKLSTTSFSITYSGSGQALYEVVFDPTTTTWRFKVYEDSVVVLNQSLGIGYDEASPYTVTQLVAAIDALANFAATGTSSVPAAFLPYTPATAIGAGVTVSFLAAASVNQPTSADDPFLQTFNNRNSSEFENVSAVETDDIILFSSKWDEQKKYDGVDCYRSGAPKSGTPSAAGSGAGGLAAGTYKYIAIIVQVDAQGNRIEGIESDSASVTTGGAQNINVTLSNVLAASGFNTDCALVNGAGQNNVTTITVDNGSGGNHTLKVGQTAYFFDAVSAGYVQRLITARTNTTITIAGAAVTVADNAVISNNLRIAIFRTVTGGSIFKELVEIPNNSFTATQVYNDGTADSSLGDSFESPALSGVEHGLPPKGGYIGIYKDRPVITGNLANPDTFFFASSDSAEYYPSSHSDFVRGQSNSPITGVTSGDRYFWLHKLDESFLVTGTLQDGQYNVSQKGDVVGCVAHATIARTDTMLVWLGDGAVFASIDGSPPFRISDDIAPALDDVSTHLYPGSPLAPQWKRSVAYFDRKNQLYVLFIPSESSQGGAVYANSNSRIFVYDLKREEWWNWDGLNMAGGVAVYDHEVIFTERRYSTFGSAMSYLVWSRLNSSTSYDYVDHSVDIGWDYQSAGWHHFGQRLVNKKFTHFAAKATDPEKAANYTLTANFEKDFIPNVFDTKLSISLGLGGSSAGWGAGLWGFFPWGNPASNRIKPRRMKPGFATAIRPQLSASGIYAEIILSGYELQIESPYKLDVNKTRET